MKNLVGTHRVLFKVTNTFLSPEFLVRLSGELFDLSDYYKNNCIYHYFASWYEKSIQVRFGKQSMFWKGKQSGSNKLFYSTLNVHKMLGKSPQVVFLH